MTEKAIILDEQAISRAVTRIAYEIIEKIKESTNAFLSASKQEEQSLRNVLRKGSSKLKADRF